MRILVAPDKFKGSLGASEVADNIAAGLNAVLAGAMIEILPVADGGEGTADAILRAHPGEWVTCDAHNAVGRAIQARYVWLSERRVAVIEMSEAAGMWRLRREELDPLGASTYGVGEMICAAAKHGAEEIIMGLGGSATNDGGLGMARALGYRFLAGTRPLGNEPRALIDLTGIVREKNAGSAEDRPARTAQSLPRIIGAADVRNSLLGPNGATRTFGPQKGVGPDQLELLENGLTQLATVVARDLDCDYRDAIGSGAAGGLGFGLLSFCNATIRPGFDVVSEIIDLEAAIRRADVVVTGEGRLDSQTLEGKAPAGVAAMARRFGKPVHAIAGAVGDSPGVRALFDSVETLESGGTDHETALANAPDLLRERARALAIRLRSS